MSPELLGALAGFSCVFMLAAAVMAAMALFIANQALTTVRAMEKSTHSVQFVEADSVRNRVEEELNGDMNEADHNAWDHMDDIHQKNEPLM